jgi:secretion/DNA translocation related TadE-like protein
MTGEPPHGAPGRRGHGSGGGGERLREDRGAATVLVAGMAVVLMVLVVLGLQLGGAVLTRHRVAAAADLAALAAAGQLVAGADGACERARWVAERMSVTTTACRVVGWEVYVEVTARPPGWAVLSGTANAHARAGPAEVPGGG